MPSRSTERRPNWSRLAVFAATAALFASLMAAPAVAHADTVAEPDHMVITGSGQSAPAGTEFPDPIAVTVETADGLPVAGATVQLDVVLDESTGDATFANGSIVQIGTTDAAGTFQTTVRAGATEGAVTIWVRVPGLDRQTVNLTVAPAPIAEDAAPLIGGDPPQGAVGAIYGDEPGFTFYVTGSPTPTVAITAGTLPHGMTLSGATLQGTPTEAGSFPLTVTATNTVGAAHLQVTLVIVGPPSPPVIGQVTPGDGQVVVDFSAGATGGPPAQYRVDVTAVADGSIQTVVGASPITVPGLTNGAQYTLVVWAVNLAGEAETAPWGPFIVGTPPALTADLPRGARDVAYNGTINIGGAPTPTINLATPEDFPPGLTLDVDTGAITGVPTSVGTFSFLIEASNAIERRVAFRFSITIGTADELGTPAETPPATVVTEAGSGSTGGTAGGSSRALAVTGAAAPTSLLGLALALLLTGGILVAASGLLRGGRVRGRDGRARVNRSA